MGDQVKDFWQEHSLKFLEMAFRTDRQERIARPDGYGKNTGQCGDTVEFFLTIKDNTLKNISFEINGCMHTNACANALAHLAEGLSLEKAWEITPRQIADFLETLPDDHFHCAELAVGAFYLALADAKQKSRQNWKKVYGKH